MINTKRSVKVSSHKNGEVMNKLIYLGFFTKLKYLSCILRLKNLAKTYLPGIQWSRTSFVSFFLVVRLKTVTAEAAGQMLASHAEFFNFLGSPDKCNLFCHTDTHSHTTLRSPSAVRYGCRCRCKILDTRWAPSHSAPQLTFMSFWQLWRTCEHLQIITQL